MTVPTHKNSQTVPQTAPTPANLDSRVRDGRCTSELLLLLALPQDQEDDDDDDDGDDDGDDDAGDGAALDLALALLALAGLARDEVEELGGGAEVG